jgi:hypothetical protein
MRNNKEVEMLFKRVSFLIFALLFHGSVCFDGKTDACSNAQIELREIQTRNEETESPIVQSASKPADDSTNDVGLQTDHFDVDKRGVALDTERERLEVAKSGLGLQGESLEVSRSSLGVQGDSLQVAKSGLGLQGESLEIARSSLSVQGDSLRIARFSLIIASLALIATITFAFLNMMILVTSLTTQKRTKQMDFVAAFNERLGQLIASLRLNLRKINHVSEGEFLAEGIDSKQFLSRFWEVQFDQFIYWERGLIPDDFFEMWMVRRHSDWAVGPSFGISKDEFRSTFNENYAQYGRFKESRSFYEMMKAIFEAGDIDPTNEIGKILRARKRERAIGKWKSYFVR